MNLIITVAVAAVLVLLIRSLSTVLLPFFVACFIAYLLQPLVELNRRIFHLRGRVVASVLTILDITAVIVSIIYLFVPSVLKEMNELGVIIHDISSGKVALPPLYQTLLDELNEYLNYDYIRNLLSSRYLGDIINGGQSLLEKSVSLLITVLSWLLTIIYVLFILIDYPQIARGFKLIVPHKYRPRFLKVFADVSISMNHYFRGQGMVALCAVIFYCFGFSIVGLPLALPMGLLVGVLYMIPYFQYVTVVPVAAVCFVYSLGGSVEFLPLMGKCGLVYLISQCICDYVITPHIMRKEMGLNPAIILLALSVWGSLLGIIGMIIALPLTSLILNYYNRYISEPGGSLKDNQAGQTGSDNDCDWVDSGEIYSAESCNADSDAPKDVGGGCTEVGTVHK